MKIDSGNIGMESERLYKSSVSLRKSVNSSGSTTLSTGSQLPTFSELFSSDGESNSYSLKGSTGSEDLSEQGSEEAADSSNEQSPLEKAMENLSARAVRTGSTVQGSSDPARELDKIRQLVIKEILALLFGEKVNMDDTEEIGDISSLSSQVQGSTSYQLVTETMVTETCTEESEATSFCATGTVKTDDGREINIDLNISMSRSFVSYNREAVSTLSYQLCDPLVVNFSDTQADLTSMKFYFDIDADGEEEAVSHLKQGSGFLALDANDDGIINDGSELFGPGSGDGFKDLASYDEDGNGWIDENDSVFEKLKIWAFDDTGESVLYTLKEKNIGAMYLGNVQTDFSLNSLATNAVNGYVRETGLFLYEDGSAGTLQHVDLVS